MQSGRRDGGFGLRSLKHKTTVGQTRPAFLYYFSMLQGSASSWTAAREPGSLLLVEKAKEADAVIFID